MEIEETRFETAEADLKRLMDDVSRAVAKSQAALAKIGVKSAAPAETSSATPE